MHARLAYRRKAQDFAVHYEHIDSRDNTSGPFSFPGRQNSLGAEWARSAGVARNNLSLAANFALPGAAFLSITESWRGAAPYDITTGLDPGGEGLFTDRGGRARNSGNGPRFNSLNVYLNKRVELPFVFARNRQRPSVSIGIQGDNLLGNKNFSSYGSVVGSPAFGQPLGASPGRSIRVWFSF